MIGANERIRTGLIGGAALDTDYDRVVSYGIRRCEFDQYLLQRSGDEVGSRRFIP